MSDQPLRRGWFAPLTRRLVPPVPLGASGSTVALLAILAVGTSFQGSIPSASITYVAREFASSTADQTRALAVIRADIILSLVALRLADRIGRRRMLLTTAILGPLLTALCATAPNLPAFAAFQVLARSMVTATAILIAVIVVEVVPAKARSWASAALIISAALGTAVAVGSVAIADSGLKVWRLLYLVPILSLPAVAFVAPRLRETARFLHQNARTATLSQSGSKSGSYGGSQSGSNAVGQFVAGVRANRQRVLVISLFLALLAFENTPTRQLQNEYLRLDRGFTSKEVAIFSVLSNAPGILGLFLGGVVGDRIGHRRVLAITIGAFLVGDAGLFLSHGSAIWAWSVFGALAGAASIPIISVLSAEVFPTSFRSTANGLTTAASRVGGALGLLAVGVLSTSVPRGNALAWTSLAPLVALVLLLPLIPETSGRELEAINPQDRPLRAQ